MYIIDKCMCNNPICGLGLKQHSLNQSHIHWRGAQQVPVIQ